MTASLAVPSSSHANVARHLRDMADVHPQELAVAVARSNGSYDELSFRELYERSRCIAAGLSTVGIGKDTRTVLMVKPSPEFFALTFALFQLEAVPVFVDPGMGIKNLGQCLDEAQPEAFIGIPKAHVARILFGWAKKSLETIVTVGPRIFWGGHSLSRLEQTAAEPPPERDTDAEDMAAVLFTSGSTGVPKGAVYRHGMFAAQVRALREVYGIEPGERDLATFPLFALFGPALGMASIVPDMDASRPAAADPSKLSSALRDYECTNMFASPALVDKLGRHAEATGCKFPSLRRVISAGAPASSPSIERLQKTLCKGTEIYTPYGATESLPTTNVSSKTILEETRHATDRGAGVCVGEPVPGMKVAIIGITEDPIETWSDDLRLADGAIGEIVVRGEVVSAAYYNRPESTKIAKIHDGNAVRHRMGDVGYLDSLGRLWMCGRKAHRVEAAEETLFTIPCEAVFNVHPKVRRTALVGVGERGQQKPVLCVEPEPGVPKSEHADIERVLRELGSEHAHTKAIDCFLFHPGFPVDVRHNAKIFREQLTEWAATQVKG